MGENGIMRIRIALPVIAACGLLTGCVATPKLSLDARQWLLRPPTRMAIGVTPNHLERDGMPFHQGMFCRIHFFVEEEPVPVAADGDLQILAFDRGKNGDDPTPVGQYVITAAEIDKHRRKDMIGDAYVFWLPYEPEKSTQMLVSATFKPKNGNPFSASPTVLHLTPLKRARPGEALAAKRQPYPQYTMIESPREARRPEVASIPLRNRIGQPQTPSGQSGFVDPQVMPASAAVPPPASPPANLPTHLPSQLPATPLPPNEIALPELP
jgi:hypothetical protein